MTKRGYLYAEPLDLGIRRSLVSYRIRITFEYGAWALGIMMDRV